MHGRTLELLQGRAAHAEPLRVGLVGAGTFGSMMLSSAWRLEGVSVVGVVDLKPERAAASLSAAGWPADEARALATDDLDELLGRDPEVLVEATGAPSAAVATAMRALDHGCHVVMVTVEADVVAGPLLAVRAREAGLVYSLAYGDQPALICELVDWAKASGFEVVCAGKGTKHLPRFSCRYARDGLARLRNHRRPGQERRLRRPHVHVVPRRNQVRHRDGSGRQCHRS